MEKRICKHCGLELTKEQLFCMRCGTKHEKEVTESSPEKEKESEEKSKENKIKESPTSEKKAPTSLKVCSKCGATLKENDSFCIKCGTKQEKDVTESLSEKEKESEEKEKTSSMVCSVCGSLLKKEQKFCMKCGAKQEEKEPSAISQPVDHEEIVVEEVKEKKEKEIVEPKIEAVTEEKSKENKIKESSTSEKKAPTSSKVCSKCGALLKENDSFCAKCGTKQKEEVTERLLEKNKKSEEKEKSSSKVCSVCGSLLKKEQKFCMKCGAKQEEKEPSANSQPVDHEEIVVEEVKEKKEKEIVEPKLEDATEAKSEENKVKEFPTSEKKAPTSPKVCFVCGSPLKDGQRFCIKCGAKQEGKESSAISQPVDYEEIVIEGVKDRKEDLVEGTDQKTPVSKEEVVTLFQEQNPTLPQKLEIPNRSFELCPNCHNGIDSSIKVCPCCGKKLKKKHRFIFFLLLLFFLLLIVFGYLFVAYRKHLFPFTLSQNSNLIVEKRLIMPNVIGKNSEEARKILEDMGLSVRMEMVETSESDKIGLVWRQETKEGTVLSKGQEITLLVYCKVGEIEMISVVGLPLEEAQKKLEDLGFIVHFQEVNDDQVEKGKVISQDKKAKEEFVKGTVVNLVVSLGKKESTPVGPSGNGSNPSQPSTNPSTNPNQSSPALPTNKEWSDWMVGLPSGVTSSKYDIESRVEYRSRNKERKVFDTEFVSGWTLVEKVDNSTPTTYVMTKKSYESRYQNNPKYQIESARPNGEYQVTVLHCDNSAHTNSVPADSNLQCPNGYQIHRVGTYSGVSKNYQVGEVFDSSRFGQYTCGYTKQSVNNTVSGVDSLYLVVMKTPSYRYYHERWTSDWSSWSVTKVVESATTSVETRTVFRYKLK